MFLVGPKTGHKFHPESKQQSDRFIQAHLPRKLAEPDHLRFVTYTTRYNQCFWLKIEALEQHYQRAEVDARRSSSGQHVTIHTRNVAQLRVSGKALDGTITVDGRLIARPDGAVKPAGGLLLEKEAGGWVAKAAPAADAPPVLRKTHGLQGPIDDAFLESFLCVRPTGTPRQKAAGQYVAQALDQCTRDFARWMHGDVRIKDDTQVTPADMAAHHLVLFGDPGSNRLLGQIADRLPLRWTPEAIVVGQKSYPAADHVLLMIYPNPLNPARYVVLNSGHTFHEPEFRGNNALVYPRLGDFAVLRLEAGKGPLEAPLEQAGLFDDHWQLPPQPEGVSSK